MWKSIKKSFRYLVDLKGEWNRDTQREVFASRIEAEGKFQKERLAFWDLQQKERILSLAVEYDKSRENTKWVAELNVSTLINEGLLNRNLQLNLSKINHLNNVELEKFRQEFNLHIQNKQREVQLELKKIEAELSRELRKFDRETALNNIREQKRINNSPLFILAEDIINSKQSDNGDTIHILYSPPHLSGTSNNTQLPNADVKFIQRLRDIFDQYQQEGYSLHFIGGAWQNKDIKGEAVAEILHKQLKTESVFILENVVENDIFYINIIFWGANWEKYIFRTATTLSWKEILYDIIKKRVEDQSAYINKLSTKIEDYIEIIGKATYDNYLHNLDVIQREQKAIANNINLSSIDRNYLIIQKDWEELISVLSNLNQCFSALYLDNYNLLYNENALTPLLPKLLQNSYFDFSEIDKGSFVKMLPECYEPTYTILQKGLKKSYTIRIDYANLLHNLSLDDDAQHEILEALKAFLFDKFPNIYYSSDASISDLLKKISDNTIRANKKFFQSITELLPPSSDLLKQNLAKIMSSSNSNNSAYLIKKISQVKDFYLTGIKIVQEFTSNNEGYANSDIVARFKEWANKCDSQSFQIAIMALVKSGKSTFLNALLGHEFLPMANTPETTIPIKIVHQSEKGNSILSNGNDIVAQGVDDIFGYLKKVNQEYRSSDVSHAYDLVLQASINAIAGDTANKINFEVFDTPGFGEAEKELIQKKKLSQTNSELIDNISVIIYLLDYTKLKTESEEEVLKKLSALRPDILEKVTDRLFFIINKFDLKNRNGISAIEAVDYVYNFISPKIPKIKKEQIFVISANNALLSRLVLNGSASDEVIEDFRKVASFGRRKDVSEEEYTQEALEVLKDSNIEKVEENIIQFIYDNRGKIFVDALLDNLSRLLSDFKNKYILTAEGTLNTTLNEIEKLENKIDLAKKNQEHLSSEADKFEKEIKQLIKNKFKDYSGYLKRNLEVVFSAIDEVEDQNKGFRKIANKAKDIFRSTTTSSKLLEEVKEMNDSIYRELKSDFSDFKSKLEHEVLLKQSDLFKQLEKIINQMARELEGVINKSLNIDIKPVHLPFDFTDLDAIKDKANSTVDRFIKSRRVEKTVKKTKRVLKTSDSCWEDDYYIDEDYWDKDYHTEYEVNKSDLLHFWQSTIQEMNNNANDIINELIESLIKGELKKAVKTFDSFISEYLHTIRVEKKSKTSMGDDYIRLRIEELKRINIEVEDLLLLVNSNQQESN